MLARIKVIQARADSNLAKARVATSLKEMKEDNSEKFKIPRNTSSLLDECPSGSTKGMSGKDRGQDRDQPRTNQY
jgi:hypothetical protein